MMSGQSEVYLDIEIERWDYEITLAVTWEPGGEDV